TEWLNGRWKRLPVHFLFLDEDIVEWFKRQGTGYQTRINAVLRSYVQAHSTKTKPKAKP
ncbi:MAG: BrnA antitoxin family protein, partial [Nitrospirota bacterium]